jgi:hypothetical protein
VLLLILSSLSSLDVLLLILSSLSPHGPSLPGLFDLALNAQEVSAATARNWEREKGVDECIDYEGFQNSVLKLVLAWGKCATVKVRRLQ